MKTYPYLYTMVAANLLFTACSISPLSPPTGPAVVILELEFAQGVVHQAKAATPLGRLGAVAQATRVEIYVTFAEDTLSRATVTVSPGASEFSAELEVPAGDDRRIVVEVWSDSAALPDAGSVLEYRGVRPHVSIVPNASQEVGITLYPLPIAGERVVMIAGSAGGASGSQGNQAPVLLITSDSIRALQFDLQFEGDLIVPDSVVQGEANTLANLESNLVSTDRGEALRCLLFDNSGQILPPLADPTALLAVEFRVNSTASRGDSSNVVLTDFVVLNARREQLQVISIPGVFKIQPKYLIAR